jgi:hypothetical protein
LKRVCWPLNFKPSGIEKYDGSTNLAEWLEVYQLAFAYLPIIISQDMAHGASHRIGTFMDQPMPVVDQQLLSHVHVTRSQLRPDQRCVEDGRVPPRAYSMLLQQEYIISDVDDKSIMFLKKGLRDLSLICKLSMKNPRTSRDMFAIANKYALVEEATLNTSD